MASSSQKTAILEVIRHSRISCKGVEAARTTTGHCWLHYPLRTHLLKDHEFWRRFGGCRVAMLQALPTPQGGSNACSLHRSGVLRSYYRSCNQPVWKEIGLQDRLNVVRTANPSDRIFRSSAVNETPFEQGRRAFRDFGCSMHLAFLKFLNSVCANDLEIFI